MRDSTGCGRLLDDLGEDAATAEVCRTRVWQWVKPGAKLNDGRPVTAESF